jgi:hypothetical protein
MRQHIVPVAERGRRNRIRRNLKWMKSPPQQVRGKGGDKKNQNGS